MTAGTRETEGRSRPELSLVMPCYNEQAIVGRSVRNLVEAFRSGGYRLELVVVDNGSSDDTGRVLQECAAEFDEVKPVTVAENRGYGFGVLSGIPHCRGEWVGIIPADGPVDPEDVVTLFEEALAAEEPVLAKVRRRFRLDSFRRKVVSVAYNLFVRLLWPGLRSLDVNGSPKIMPRDTLLRMKPSSTGWLLDPEMMIKAHRMGVRVLEVNVMARLRTAGVSQVRPQACWEFARTLVAYRLAPQRYLWKETPELQRENALSRSRP